MQEQDEQKSGTVGDTIRPAGERQLVYVTPTSLMAAIRNALSECDFDETKKMPLDECVLFHVIDWLAGKVMVAVIQKPPVELRDFWGRLPIRDPDEKEGAAHAL